MRTVVVNYGMGNLRSIQHKLAGIGFACDISAEARDVERAELLILPGVGHFGAAMGLLHQQDLVRVLDESVLGRGTPILGICLGMQLLSRSSEEGDAEGLGWIDAVTRRFAFPPAGPRLKVPHIGWNTLEAKPGHELLQGITPGERFYFTHSYHLCCASGADVVATTNYGYDFVSVVRHGNIVGTQFHPEKSHRAGMKLLANILRSLEESAPPAGGRLEKAAR